MPPPGRPAPFIPARAHEEYVPSPHGFEYHAAPLSRSPPARSTQMTMQRTFIDFRRLLTLACVLLGTGLIGGCVYRIDIQQGNFLKPEDVERVKVGMTRVQVRALLGTPMIADPFKTERWDYVYYLKRGKLQRVYQRHFTVWFDEQDKVVRIEDDQNAANKRVADSGEPKSEEPKPEEPKDPEPLQSE